jgi:pimeloyl-ACP methyl ester carboxylesterase
VSESANREFVALESATSRVAGAGGHPCQGLYWTPRTRRRPTCAFIANHYNGDFSEHYLAPHLAELGYGFLGWNTRFRGAEDAFTLEHALIDIGAGVRWLRDEAGVEQVVLLGNSGGGSLMAAYQAASRGALDWPELPGVALDALHSLPGGDFYISLNAHPGRPDVLTEWLDPAVLDETDPVPTDPELDAFHPERTAPFDADFVSRYREAQRERNHRITRWAQAELERVNAAGFVDRLFPLFRTWADLRFLDGTIDPSDRPCPACYAGDPRLANRSPFGLGRANTLRTWLSMWGLETSRCRGELHLPHIDLPALVLQSLGDTGVFPSHARTIEGLLGAADKQLEWLPGDHYFREPEDARSELAARIAGWLQTRR